MLRLFWGLSLVRVFQSTNDLCKKGFSNITYFPGFTIGATPSIALNTIEKPKNPLLRLFWGLSLVRVFQSTNDLGKKGI